ncbi:MAG: hypothetical protein IKI75_06275 [Lachnospiraceae bacterium]|nr:hypothetical protein [Lachnospiraceae bacterium]
MENTTSRKISMDFVFRFLLIVAVVALLVTAAFYVFHVHSRARFALREAKNVRLALATADIEMYPTGGCIYAPEKRNGLADGVMEKVKRYAGVSEGVTLLDYDKKNREILRFTYRTENYLVSYDHEGEDGGWRVDLLTRIFVY